MTIPQLRDYQEEAVQRLRSELRAGARAPLLVLPTGGGKTVIFCYVASSACARGNRVLVLVHRQELLSQTSRSLSDLGVTHGQIAAGYSWQPRMRVQVASVQTLVRRLDRVDASGWAPDLIIVDEAHHATAGSWAKILAHWPQATILGVTATPCRMDGRGLGADHGGCFDALVDGPQIGELIDRGYLSPPEVYAPPRVADLSGVRTRGGDFDKRELGERMDKVQVTGDAVGHYARLCEGAPAIAFCVSVAHAEHVAAQFRDSGWQAASIDGSMEDRQRRQRIEDLAAGRLHVLTSCDIISEGTDIPVVGAAILLRPTKSLGLYLQQVGRALRIYPGKTRAVILDHVGNVSTHGLPDDERDWSLEGAGRRKRGKGEPQGPPPPVTCTSCFVQIRAPAPAVCPSCGEPLRKGGRQVEQVDGELQRVAESEGRRMRSAEVAQARSLQALVKLGHDRGYRSPMAWAQRVMAARQARGR